MKQMEEQISFLKKIIVRDDFSLEQQEKYRTQMEMILKRKNQKNLQIAIVGEFSSGKSTLINAMIGKNLLKTAFMATTAIPTRLREGPGQLTVRGTLRQEKTWKELFRKYEKKTGKFTVYRLEAGGTGKNFWMNLVGITEKGGKKLLTETLTRRCLKLSGEIQTLEDLLAEITTREEVVCLFEQVEVLLEPGSLGEQLEIIDTPGTNPGSESAREHRRRTQEVLMKEADTAVILFPADRVYTASFEQFLRENASRLLENSLLLVTMMDRVPPEERQEILDYTEEKLKERFHLKDPKILFCAAGRAKRDPYWRENFQQVKRSFLTYMKSGRITFIRQHLMELLEQMMDDLNGDLEEKKRSLTREYELLWDNSVPALTGVLGGLEKQALAEIEACRIPLPSRQEQEGICRCAYEKAKEQMDAITTRSELRQYLQKEEGLLGTVVSAARPLADQAQKLQKKLDALEKKWEKEIGKKTAFYYGRLTEGRAALENVNARLSPDSAAREIDAGLQHIRIMGQKEESRTDWATMLTGLGVGILLGGPALWVIGGMVGLIGGDWLLVGKMRQKDLEEFARELPALMDNYSREIWMLEGRMIKESKDHILAVKEEYQSRYQAVYEKLRQEFEEEKKDLEDRIRRTERLIHEIGTRRAQLKQQSISRKDQRANASV